VVYVDDANVERDFFVQVGGRLRAVRGRWSVLWSDRRPSEAAAAVYHINVGAKVERPSGRRHHWLLTRRARAAAVRNGAVPVKFNSDFWRAQWVPKDPRR